jgi:hypothetical protein
MQNMSNSRSAGQPFSLEDFKFYIFHGLRDEFKDLVISLVTKVEPLLYADLHNHLLTHEFLHKTSLQSLAANPPLLPSVHLAQQQHTPNFSRNRDRSRGNWRSNSNKYNNQHRFDFHGSHSSAPTD